MASTDLISLPLARASACVKIVQAAQGRGRTVGGSVEAAGNSPDDLDRARDHFTAKNEMHSDPYNKVEMPKSAKSAPLRRSTRVQARIPVTLSGTLPDGSQFTEDTYILTLSKFGAKVTTKQPLKVGMQVRVQPKRGSETATLFRVVWVGRQGTPQAGEIGVEYVEVSNPFEVNFPG